MCSELPYYIKPAKLIAYHTSSTNSSHLKCVERGFQRGLFKMINENDLQIQTSENEVSEKYDET